MFEPEYMEVEASCSDCLNCAVCVTFPGLDAELAGTLMLAQLG
ncbi:hypothetical protein [Ruminiclostridium herbifermentans]|nr:hypothetical protein [Ruminiclostridium herbifermentans]